MKKNIAIVLLMTVVNSCVTAQDVAYTRMRISDSSGVEYLMQIGLQKEDTAKSSIEQIFSTYKELDALCPDPYMCMHKHVNAFFYIDSIGKQLPNGDYPLFTILQKYPAVYAGGTECKADNKELWLQRIKNRVRK